MGVQGVQCPDYEERQDSLLRTATEGSSMIKVASMTKEAVESLYDHHSRPKE
jgi:hypothetical protein